MAQTDEPVGIGRRFGSSGPVYEIVRAGAAIAENDQLMRVRLVESGEELDYRLNAILDDPAA